jgi:hypothetical protein
MDRVRPLELVAHHSNNLERSIPAESRVDQVLLDDTLMVAADNVLLLELVAELKLGLESVVVLEALPASNLS